jgi:hypothetical protein
MYLDGDDEAGEIRHPRWLPLCDTPDRLGARMYLALRVRCHCCTFFRGVALGMLFGAAIASAVAALLP